MSTYDDASLIYYPSGYKAGKAYSLKPTDGSGDLTFTRASTATRVNLSGLIESVATGVPRIDYTGGGCGKLLLEPQRTNLLLQSNNFINANWSISDITLNSNTLDTLSPEGVNNATKITTITYPTLFSVIAVSAQTQYTFSFYAKKGTLATPKLAIRDDSNGAFIVQDISYTISTDEWTRVQYTVTTPIGCTSLRVYPLRGSGGGTIYLYGMQVEQGSYPTSYIPTTTTSVTRTQDSASKSGISSLINSEEGVLYIESTALANDATWRMMSLTDGTSNNKVNIAYKDASNTISAQYRISNVAVVEFTHVVPSITTNLKIAFKYSLNNFSLWINGVKVGESFTGSVLAPNTLNKLDSNLGSGALYFFANLQNLMVFPSALSDTELATLTTL